MPCDRKRYVSRANVLAVLTRSYLTECKNQTANQNSETKSKQSYFTEGRHHQHARKIEAERKLGFA